MTRHTIIYGVIKKWAMRCLYSGDIRLFRLLYEISTRDAKRRGSISSLPATFTTYIARFCNVPAQCKMRARHTLLLMLFITLFDSLYSQKRANDAGLAATPTQTPLFSFHSNSIFAPS